MTHYLGLAIIVGVDTLKQRFEWCSRIIEGKFRKWANKLLSYPSRLTIAKHVLESYIVYVSMVFLFSKNCVE